MSAIRQKGTACELLIRKELHARGLRYRLHVPVPGRSRRTIDIAFRPVKLAIMVDGCFWHSCPSHATVPKTNTEWWVSKLSENKFRDRDTDAALMENGWSVVRVWEHEDPRQVAGRVEALRAELSVVQD